MKHKKVNLSVILSLVIGLTGLQAQSTLYIKEKAGNQFSYEINSISKLTFLAGNMIINEKAGNNDYFILRDIRYLNFIDLPTDILPVQNGIGSTTLYPNPVIDKLQISFESETAEDILLEIVDIQGRVLYNQKIFGQNGTNFVSVSVAELSSGIYICHMHCGNLIKNMKFQKN